MGVTQVKGTWLCKQQETSAKGGERVETLDKNGTVRMPFSVLILMCASIFDYFRVFVKALCFLSFSFFIKHP